MDIPKNKRSLLKCLSGSVVGLIVAACATAPSQNPWSQKKEPLPGPAESIGEYAAGCLVGAASLPPDGPGYQIMRLTRGRFYGHPELIRFLQDIAKRGSARKLGPILIGDLGQPWGGPSLTGHRSHQTGLDADLWFWRPEEASRLSLTLDQRENLSAQSVLHPSGSGLNTQIWGRRQAQLLKLVAEDPRVDRIFVHAEVKQALCSQEARTSPSRKAWLAKLRPWWGHHYHFHVRLKCPADSSACSAQPPLPVGDGCDETLAWWFSEEARQKPSESKDEQPPKMPEMPKRCEDLIQRALTK